MTTYASPLAEAQGKLAAARSKRQNATRALSQTQAALAVAESAIEKWAEDWPNLAEQSDRPRFRGRDGLGVLASGDPAMSKDGRLQLGPDITIPPPPSHDTIVKLRAAVAKAEQKERTALKAEIKAQSEWEPPSETGWIVMKQKRINGVRYAIGDSFDPTSVEPRKVEQFKRVGLIAHG